MTMQKVFKIDGDSICRFGKSSKKEIAKWLNGVDYEYAIQYAKEVSCPVFGSAIDFPCIIIKQI